MQREECYEIALVPQRETKPSFVRQESEENRTSSPLRSGILGRSVFDQEESQVDEANLCSTSPICPAPLCRQFWKAGSYNEGLVSKPILQSIISKFSLLLEEYTQWLNSLYFLDYKHLFFSGFIRCLLRNGLQYIKTNSLSQTQFFFIIFLNPFWIPYEKLVLFFWFVGIISFCFCNVQMHFIESRVYLNCNL